MSFTQSRTPTLEEVLRAALNSRIMDLHVALPGRVESYDLENQAVDVKPLLKRTFLTAEGEDISESLPVIPSVPVLFQRAGGFFLSLPIQKGDFVFLIFNERSIDKWITGSGEETDPVDTRMHSLSDAVAFPCFYPFSESISDAHADNLVIGKDSGPQAHFKASEIHIGAENASDFAAQAQKTLNELTAIINGYNVHTHPTGVGPSGPPTPLLSPASPVAATKVKVE